jgi:class 3 adenylate cyclase
MVFLLTIFTFFCFNNVVERRQHLLSREAAQSAAIVSSLFPKQVRDKLMQEQEKNLTGKLAPTNRLKSFLSNVDMGEIGKNQLADLFPHCSVIFSDIAGFTAWSSTRGPDEVFTLLQTVYHGFDEIAKRRRVFKVETIGDSYLAVTGLPEPQKQHAVIMARFAWECKQRMSDMMKELEVTLGPDCSDLVMRFGIHSGPVTAGVLRGDRARFQLFGDTVNTGKFPTPKTSSILLRTTLTHYFLASRMESTGIKDKIHISQTTADLIIEAGKSHWVKPRDDSVNAKGKGVLRTYWLKSVTSKSSSKKGSDAASTVGSHTDECGASSGPENSPVSMDIVKHNRLIDWMVRSLILCSFHMLYRLDELSLTLFSSLLTIRLNYYLITSKAW